MTADQILEEIKALPTPELARQREGFRELQDDQIPGSFIEPHSGFENGRFVSMETALNEVPPGESVYPI